MYQQLPLIQNTNLPLRKRKKQQNLIASTSFVIFRKKKIVTTNNLLSCNSSIYISYLADETLSFPTFSYPSARN